MNRHVVAALALIALSFAVPSGSPTMSRSSDPSRAPHGPRESSAPVSGADRGDTVPRRSAVSVAAGGGYTCAVTRGGGVECWGTNGSGQLGARSPASSSVPVHVAALRGRASTVTTGEQHGCALLRSGRIACWGANESGQLGDGTRRDRRKPTRVRGLVGRAVAVSAGLAYTCALLKAGVVECWGANQFGQLGDGSLDDRVRPVRVRGLPGAVVRLSAGGRHTCAVMRRGAVECWGADYWGQLGDGRAREHSGPVRVRRLPRAAGVDAGLDYTCAVTRDGAVECWGANAYGQLGNGTTVGRRLPQRVRGHAAEAVAVSAAERHTCAVLRSGATACWGANGSGQLGNGTLRRSRVAVSVSGVDTAAAVSTGDFHTCAVTAAGGVLCWGMNASGELGAGTLLRRSTPLRVAGVSDAVDVAAGGEHTCARTRPGGVTCWGANASGQLGDRTRLDSSTPVPLSGLPEAASSLSAGDRHTCAVTSGGAVECWGANDWSQLGDGTVHDRWHAVPVRGLPRDAVAVAAGENHTCALSGEGVVRCWGANTSGQLGDGTFVARRYPVRVLGLPKAAAISAGGRNTCAVTALREVECWGADDWGQIGAGRRLARPRPTRVTHLPGVAVAVASGDNHTCALMGGGAVMCWGAYLAGPESGRRSASRPPVSRAGTRVSAGGRHTCALMATGRVACWGANDSGQLGDGTRRTRRRAVAVRGFTSSAVAVSAGADHSCGVTSAGSVACWGWNYWGQLGAAGPPASGSPTPVPVVGLG